MNNIFDDFKRTFLLVFLSLPLLCLTLSNMRKDAVLCETILLNNNEILYWLLGIK